ncbi:MAG: hypothetical protein OXE44_13445 [Nitrospinae bacterium]|nr:hypothetical protein [Nitrospinota bacterium]
MPNAKFQGTDGVRGLVVDEDHPQASGHDARAAFVENGVLTPRFIEHYVFEAGKWLLERASEQLISPTAVVLAWDPRDTGGELSAACVNGLLRAGAHALSLGVMPTPAAAAYLAGVGGAGAVILTASHNPAEQNGVKILLSPDSMKPLPDQDAALSDRVWASEWSAVAQTPESGHGVEAAAEARAFYVDYVTQLPNCWLREGDLARWSLVVDPAAGAWSGVAAQVLEESGPLSVCEVNGLSEGRVNENGGVVALEGRRIIEGEDAEFIAGHAGARALFEAGRERREELKRGDGMAAACVLDADGDRGYALVYNPFLDALHVLDGDDALVLQARFLKGEGELPEGGVAAITIESDSGAAAALAETGLRVVFTPVGDKWILNEARRWGDRFALGGEESGHTIAPGLLVNALGEGRRIAVGDGFKSFLNTIAAVRSLFEEANPEEAYATIAAPFPRGFKRSYYAYHVERSRFAPGTEAWEAIAKKLMEVAESAFPGIAAPRFAPLEDDAGVMYLALEDESGGPLGAVYVRNSGTESRTGVVMRGPAEWEEKLCAVGDGVLREIIMRMKDYDAPGARAEACLLEALREREMDAVAADALLDLDSEARFGAPLSPPDIRKEVLRGGLVREEAGTFSITPLGEWYLEQKK